MQIQCACDKTKISRGIIYIPGNIIIKDQTEKPVLIIEFMNKFNINNNVQSLTNTEDITLKLCDPKYQNVKLLTESLIWIHNIIVDRCHENIDFNVQDITNFIRVIIDKIKIDK